MTSRRRQPGDQKSRIARALQDHPTGRGKREKGKEHQRGSHRWDQGCAHGGHRSTGVPAIAKQRKKPAERTPPPAGKAQRRRCFQGKPPCENQGPKTGKREKMRRETTNGTNFKNPSGEGGGGVRRIHAKKRGEVLRKEKGKILKSKISKTFRDKGNSAGMRNRCNGRKKITGGCTWPLAGGRPNVRRNWHRKWGGGGKDGGTFLHNKKSRGTGGPLTRQKRPRGEENCPGFLGGKEEPSAGGRKGKENPARSDHEEKLSGQDCQGTAQKKEIEPGTDSPPEPKQDQPQKNPHKGHRKMRRNSQKTMPAFGMGTKHTMEPKSRINWGKK